jgi:hypothetical protein
LNPTRTETNCAFFCPLLCFSLLEPATVSRLRESPVQNFSSCESVSSISFEFNSQSQRAESETFSHSLLPSTAALRSVEPLGAGRFSSHNSLSLISFQSHSQILNDAIISLISQCEMLVEGRKGQKQWREAERVQATKPTERCKALTMAHQAERMHGACFLVARNSGTANRIQQN